VRRDRGTRITGVRCSEAHTVQSQRQNSSRATHVLARDRSPSRRTRRAKHRPVRRTAHRRRTAPRRETLRRLIGFDLVRAHEFTTIE